MTADLKQVLNELEDLDFSGKGEAFVESRFLTPLLKCLGYEQHKDYEVIRHGDDGSAFKLHYPPVEKGAQRVKHYNPDYVPTIRKKMFWIIEAKSPKDVSYPFDVKYLVQGLQYCIHPEIQAKYLLVTNGLHSAVYDAHGAVFFEKETYEPILEFRSSDLLRRWAEIFKPLSVETLRARIEVDLKAMYDKLSLSSLDKDYPRRLLQHIGSSVAQNARQIEKHALTLYLESMDRDRQGWCDAMEQLDAAGVFELMDVPLRPGPIAEGHYFVKKCLAAGMPPQDILRHLTDDFDGQGIFRKIQSFLAVRELYFQRADPDTRALCRAFFDRYKEGELPLLNQVECAFLRLTRKISVVSPYPPLRQRLASELATAPELIRFVRPPTPLDVMYPVEILQNRQMLERIRLMPEDELRNMLTELLKTETSIEADFRTARAQLSHSESQIGGFEGYGVGGKHYAFKNILIECGLEPNDTPR
jgi:hypothetical protein